MYVLPVNIMTNAISPNEKSSVWAIRKRSKRMTKAEKIINLISLIFYIWILLSFFDILAHNMTDYNYASWNAIEIFYKVAIK